MQNDNINTNNNNIKGTVLGILMCRQTQTLSCEQKKGKYEKYVLILKSFTVLILHQWNFFFKFVLLLLPYAIVVVSP